MQTAQRQSISLIVICIAIKADLFHAPASTSSDSTVTAMPVILVACCDEYQPDLLSAPMCLHKKCRAGLLHMNMHMPVEDAVNRMSNPFWCCAKEVHVTSCSQAPKH